MNEGLCILNNETNVIDLFTDGLVGCTQVILRSELATFTCHLDVKARAPARWMHWAADLFSKEYGKISYCAIITSDPSYGVADEVAKELKPLLGQVSITAIHAGGCLINIATGKVTNTPTNIHSQDMAGWKTARDVIKHRMLGTSLLGEALAGDYDENCPRCTQKEREALNRQEESDVKYDALERQFKEARDRE